MAFIKRVRWWHVLLIGGLNFFAAGFICGKGEWFGLVVFPLTFASVLLFGSAIEYNGGEKK